MIAWPVALVVGLLLAMFGILAFLIALAVWVRFIVELFRLKDSDGFLGWLWLAVIVLPFTYMVGLGAWRLTGEVVGGFIGRFM